MYYPDINECAASNGGCQHICVDEEGSYKCSCRPGYSLTPDRHSCEGKRHSI